MPKIEILTPEGPSSYMTQLLMDGREIGDVRAIDLHIGLDEVVTATVEVLASERLSFTGAADVYVTVMAMPGWVVVEEGINGVKRYRTEPAHG